MVIDNTAWSAPASISPNNLSTGLLAGIDVYDCILVLRDPRAVEGFFTHKFTLGAEIGIAAGPYGSGGSVESGMEKASVFSYIRSKGLYAGIEITGTVSAETLLRCSGLTWFRCLLSDSMRMETCITGMESRRVTLYVTPLSTNSYQR
jgi:hypothetical protein